MSVQWVLLKMAILKTTKLYIKQISKGEKMKKALWFTREVSTIGKQKYKEV